MRLVLRRLSGPFVCSVALLSLVVGPAVAAEPPDLSRMVVIGDSLSAGFQNYALYDGSGSPSGTSATPGGQTYGFAAQIAAQAGVDLHLPLISLPGLPPVLVLAGPPHGIDTELERPTYVGSRTTAVQTRNLSVPGFTAANILLYSVKASEITDPSTASVQDALALEVLGVPGTCGVFPWPNGEVYLSEVECAAQLRPSVVIASVGANDALQAVLDGIAPTNLESFRFSYNTMLAVLRFSRAHIVVSNIPDVTTIPALISYQEFHDQCGVYPADAGPEDYVVPYLSNPTAFAFSFCTNYAVRPASLIKEAKTAVVEYNKVINEAARLFDATVVDVNGTLAEIAAHGYTADGHHLTTEYLGGIFSLDGVHPTNTGYAILGNAYIEAMNKHLHTSIPLISVDKVAATDPLVNLP